MRKHDAVILGAEGTTLKHFDLLERLVDIISLIIFDLISICDVSYFPHLMHMKLNFTMTSWQRTQAISDLCEASHIEEKTRIPKFPISCKRLQENPEIIKCHADCWNFKFGPKGHSDFRIRGECLHHFRPKGRPD